MDRTDRIALHELAALYGDVVDARDWDGLRRVFTDDVVYSSPASARKGPGRDRCGTQVHGSISTSPRPSHHQHPGRGRRSRRPAAVAVILITDEGLTRSGEYEDEVAPTPEGSAHRTAVVHLPGPTRPTRLHSPTVPPPRDSALVLMDLQQAVVDGYGGTASSSQRRNERWLRRDRTRCR